MATNCSDGLLPGGTTIAAAAHPGGSRTELTRNLPQAIGRVSALTEPLFQDPAMGALPTLRAATEPAVAEIKDYRDTVAALRTEFGDAHVYPGSPWLAAHTLRAQDRDGLQAHLARCGISTAVHYPKPLHRQQALAQVAPSGELPVSERLCNQVLSIPLYPELPEEWRDRVVREIRAFYAA